MLQKTMDVLNVLAFLSAMFKLATKLTASLIIRLTD
jgi:hypothetical protein